jgi:hypothetical protein
MMARRPIGRYRSQDATGFRSMPVHNEDASGFRSMAVHDQDATGFRSVSAYDQDASGFRSVDRTERAPRPRPHGLRVSD